MIKYKVGDMFVLKTPPDALVNPVNCVGVAGSGLALEFKRRYPYNHGVYLRATGYGTLSPGDVLIVPLESPGPPYAIINFATKDHWSRPSQLEWIEQGLKKLAIQVGKHEGLQTVAVPALGCGRGELDWRDVKPLMETELNRNAKARAKEWLVFRPMGSGDED